ncbi:right-handed parallel beta-helix repeat-containing protein [Patescibacteria group bacterium]
MKKILMIITVMLLLVAFAGNAHAANDCLWGMSGMTMELQNDCTTDETLFIPDDYTFDGNNYTVTAVDPDGGHFVGAVVANEGDEAYVTHLNISASELSNACDGGADRLRGIMFEGASGSILHSSVVGINQGPSGCQEGNAIEIRNAPFNGEHPDTMSVEVAHNEIYDYQKTGIVANGDVYVNIHHNKVGASATQENLAANSVQLGFGATGLLEQNQIEGNQWFGESDWVGTAVLIYAANDLEVSKNIIGGNSEIGIYNYGDDNVINNNKVFDDGADISHGDNFYDYGIGNYGSGNVITNNKVKGFEEPYEGVEGGKNKAIPGGQPGNPWF